MRLSEHFTLSELTKSTTALRLGITNTPNERQIGSLIKVCEEVLEPVRAHFGKPIIPSSGFRCFILNKAIGSKDTSQHTKGEAVDFEVPGVDNKELHEWIRDYLNFDQNILEYYTEGEPQSGWCHVSISDVNRSQSFSQG